MGRKISVDSATLMNKGLELIEACLLFDLPPSRWRWWSIRRASCIRWWSTATVQCSRSWEIPTCERRLRMPLGWPERIVSGVESLDIVRAGRLDFEAPDLERFPCLVLARPCGGSRRHGAGGAECRQ